MKKIGVLELCSPMGSGFTEDITNLVERMVYVGVTPQAVAVWCREMGHQVYYATYYGIGDPRARLPDDLDFVFISTITYIAPLAYALSKVFRRQGVRTVLGGPHAKAFPQDAQRYFDLVVLECDKALVADILADRFPLPAIVSSPAPYEDLPTVEERLPDLKASSFRQGKPSPYGSIPMLASMGCPYTCNFCVDWNNRYRPLSAERLAADLRFAAERLPGVPMAFYDPNFGIRFDETMAIFESVPPGRRSPYGMESSLSNLRSPERLQRLRDTHCIAVAPGIESWSDYSNKAGVGKATSQKKLEQVLEHLALIQEYVPYIQANFIMGIDSDGGDEPFELTKEFLRRAPTVFPCFFVPVAYGGTPLFSTFLKEGRILNAMPFSFYYTPHLTLILKHYDALAYMEKMADLYAQYLAPSVVRMHLAAKTPRYVKAINLFRTFSTRDVAAPWRGIARRLRTDRHFRAFHAGESETLPDYYAGEYRRRLGKYSELMPISEARPLLSDEPVTPLTSGAAAVPMPASARPLTLFEGPAPVAL